MLLREGLGRRHERSLAAGLDRPQERVERDDGLPRADVALEEPLHRLRVAEIPADLPDRGHLLRGELEGQGGVVALDQLAVAGQSLRARELLERAAAALEAQLEREELLEGQPLAGGLGLGAVERAVRCHERVRPERQPLLVAEPCGERVGEEADARQRRVHEGPQPVGGQAPHWPGTPGRGRRCAGPSRAPPCG